MSPFVCHGEIGAECGLQAELDACRKRIAELERELAAYREPEPGP